VAALRERLEPEAAGSEKVERWIGAGVPRALAIQVPRMRT